MSKAIRDTFARSHARLIADAQIMQRYKDVRELRTIFEEFGSLADINVPINQVNNQPRGFAFAEYKRSTYADA